METTRKTFIFINDRGEQVEYDQIKKEMMKKKGEKLKEINLPAPLPTLRVREIIPSIDYQFLVDSKIIPDNIFTKKTIVKPFPSWAYKYGICLFGIFIQNLIFKALDGLNAKEWEEFILPSFIDAYQTDKIPFSLQDKKTRGFFFGIFNFVPGELKGDCQFEKEILVNNIKGHPDLLNGNTILDIKTTRNFENMRKETVLQLLSYAAIQKANKKEISHIGVLLPIQKKILSYNISNWDHQVFLEILFSSLESTIRNISYLSVYSHRIGYHISKKKTLLETFKNSKGLQTIQFFLASPRAKSYAEFPDIKEGNKYLKENKINCYVHAPYYINLGKNNIDWALDILKHELKLANKIGCKGVVVHLGANKNKKEGLKYLKENIEYLSGFATIECPLLLETNAGEGNDLCFELQDFINLYKNIKNKKTIGICMDSCHVFASGYRPEFFLEKVLKEFGKYSVALIHFNDSENPINSRKDRHYRPGEGYIGYYSMGEVLKKAIENGIDLVIE